MTGEGVRIGWGDGSGKRANEAKVPLRNLPIRCEERGKRSQGCRFGGELECGEEKKITNEPKAAKMAVPCIMLLDPSCHERNSR
jgi:hypothetical protein